jgi:hypothetical protein
MAGEGARGSLDEHEGEHDRERGHGETRMQQPAQGAVAPGDARRRTGADHDAEAGEVL